MWIADGFFTIPRRAARSVGAMTALAATVRECAGPGQRKSEAPDNEIAFVARRGIKSVVLRSGILRPNEREKFIARLLVVAESAEHGAGDGLAMLFLNAAHLHAQMAGFDDYADALRSDFFLDRFRDLAGHAFLNLQPPREHIDQARYFARIDLFGVVMQQKFFRWFSHGRFPSGLTPAYSKLLFPVSSTRMRSSFALGKDFRR